MVRIYILKKIFLNRLILVGLALVAQVALMVNVILQFRRFAGLYLTFNIIISLIAVLLVVNTKMSGEYKMAWLIPILILPVFGGLSYLIFGGKKLSKKVKKKMKIVQEKMEQALTLDYTLIEIDKKISKDAISQSTYIKGSAFCPVYQNTETEYFPLGEDYFKRLIETLKKAKKFIFLEYFIIAEGKVWKEILDILEEKAKQGVDVRVMYDDIGSIGTLELAYPKVLEAKGIACCVFNPFAPVLTSRINNRDHRKIAVIDGFFGFTGGINLADEYANIYERFGHWKDTGIMLKGEGVWSLTVMFLSLWDYVGDIDEDYEKFRPEKYRARDTKGFVQPYADSPLDDEPVGQIVYLNLINKAKDYIYINTPYLIIDGEMSNALCNAAKAGIDVKIITPNIPDKKIVHALSRSYYRELMNSGVKIYEYLPGFNHAKSFVVDDEYGVVGTVNLDYRSLYLHYECGVWMYNTDTIVDIKKDYLETLKKCGRVSIEHINKTPLYKVLIKSLLRVVAPLL